MEDYSEGYSEGVGSGCNDYDERCERCNALFTTPSAENGMQDYDGDRCDTCAKPHHTERLQTYHELRGEWRLCLDCLLSRSRDPTSSVPGDFRRIPKTFWEQLYSRFPQRAAEEVEPTGRLSRASIEEVVKLRQALDSHLDHMVKYLELDSQGRVPEQFRKSILETAKHTMAWKCQQLTHEDLNLKIDKLSTFMSKGLAQHGLIK